MRSYGPWLLVDTVLYSQFLLEDTGHTASCGAGGSEELLPLVCPISSLSPAFLSGFKAIPLKVQGIQPLSFLAPLAITGVLPVPSSASHKNVDP